MTTELFAPDVFKWILTILTGGLAGSWFVYDFISLIRARNKKDTPLERDKRFGYMIGILVGAIGIIGCLRFHDVV